jgi:hypothetical protein
MRALLLILPFSFSTEPDPFPERHLDGFDPVHHREHIRSVNERRQFLLEQRERGDISELEFLAERAKLRVQARLLRAGVKLARENDAELPQNEPEEPEVEETDPPTEREEVKEARRRAIGEKMRIIREQGGQARKTKERRGRWSNWVLGISIGGLLSVAAVGLFGERVKRECQKKLSDRSPAAFREGRL